MNNKLAKFAGQNIVPKPHKGGGCIKHALVSLSKKLKRNSTYVCVSLHHRAVVKLGWQLGDHIRMDITDDGDIVLSRDNTYGTALYKAGNGRKICRKYISYRVVPEFYNAITEGAGSDVEIDTGRIAFCVE